MPFIHNDFEFIVERGEGNILAQERLDTAVITMRKELGPQFCPLELMS